MSSIPLSANSKIRLTTGAVTGACYAALATCDSSGSARQGRCLLQGSHRQLQSNPGGDSEEPD